MTLKNIKKGLFLLTVLFATGCTDLDVDVKSQFTDDNFPVTEADMEAVCGPAYTIYRPTYGRWSWLMVTASSDEGMLAVNGGNWYDNGKYGEMSLHSWTTSNEIVYLVWDALFSSISQCNQIMSILDKASDSESKTKSMIEMRAMRALYYYWAMDYYGGLPIITGFGQDTPDRSTRKETAEFIMNELKDCIEELTTTVDRTTYSKPTKYMAETLLAKLYLNWPVYTASDVSDYDPSDANPYLNEVVALCDDIILSGEYNLNDDWIEKFKENNGYQIKDFIFAFPYDWATDDVDLSGGLTHSRFWCHKFFQYTFNMSKNPSGVMRGIPEFIDKYNLEGDVRNQIWRGGKQYYEGTNTPYVYNLSKGSLDNYYTGADKDERIDWEFELTKELVIRGATEGAKAENLRMLDLGNDELGLAMGYRNVKIYPTLGSTTHWQSNDMPILRYADVVLMKAEAILRGANATNGDTPASLVNEIRTCAGAPTVNSVTLEELIDERAREFADEYWRRTDLIRFGHFEDDWGLKSAEHGTANKDKYRRIFPVPREIMKLNTHWTQNPGYSD